MAAKKREEPVPVDPVLLDGVRYEAVLSGAEVGIPQDGGVVAALDPGTGRLLWAAKIYEPEHDPGMEDDKQDVFIKSMLPGRDGRSLVIVSETGAEYLLDLATRAVRQTRRGG